jgi:CheY-like chemotaxis protein
VRLPIATAAATSKETVVADEAPVTAPLALPASSLLENLRIVLVDDAADGRTLTSLILTQAGATVRSVATVRDALRVLESDHVDALVSDIGLPDEDGYSLIRAIRHREAEHGGCLPALALTGHARAEDSARSRAAGFEAYLSKPVEPKKLTAAVAAMTHQFRDNT